MRALAATVDWTAFRAIARRDGTTAAVHRRLRAAGVGMPQDVATAFEREASVLDFHRLRLERALQSALDVLTRAGLRPVLLKGAAVARVAYARAVDRPMTDADLLLAPADADAAVRLLRAAGWRDAPGDPDGGADSYAAHHHLPPLVAPDGSGALLEVHRDVLPAGHPFAWDGAAVLARASAWTDDGGVLLPDPVDLLLHACVHFAWAHELRHGAWRTFADLSALLSATGVDGRPLVDASTVAGRADDGRASSVVGWTLRLAHELAGVTTPAPLRRLVPAGMSAGPLVRALAGEFEPGGARAPSVAVGRLAWERAIRPERSGHGSARPWRVGRGGVPAERDGGRATTPRMLVQVRRLGRWARWLRRVLGR